MREILSELIEEVGHGRPVAYTALVETRGSTPQKAGAVMLVFEDGSQAGTLHDFTLSGDFQAPATEIGDIPNYIFRVIAHNSSVYQGLLEQS